MKPVRLAFESSSRLLTRSRTRSRTRSLSAVAALLLAAAAFAWSAWRLWTQHEALEATAAGIQRADAALLAARPAPPQAAVSPAQREGQQRIAAQLNTPWSALLDALEAATPPEAAVVSIEPDMRQAVVRVQAEARTLATLLAYAGALQEVALFESVELVRHETFEQDANRPLRLTLLLRLKKAQESAP